MPNRRKIVMPTDEENEAINRGIAADSDTYEVPPEDFDKMKPVGEGDRRLAYEKARLTRA